MALTAVCSQLSTNSASLTGSKHQQNDVNVSHALQWFVCFVGEVRRETGRDGVVGAEFF